MKKITLAFAFLLAIGSTTVWANDSSRHQSASVVHNILSDKLPASLLSQIKEDYKGYWISQLSEEVKHKETSYFITVENADQIIQLSATDSENWVVTNTTLKD